MTESKATKGEWIHIKADFSDFDIAITTQARWDANEVNITEITVDWGGELANGQRANAHLISQAPAMYKEIESLIYELSMAIDEVNTMRDIHHTDRLTPADHWDKESCHNAQVLLSKCRGE